MTVQKLIGFHEGRRRRPYRCPAGHMTIGIGHNCDVNGLPADMKQELARTGQITDEMIDTLYRADEYSAICACRRLYDNWDEVDEVRQMALIDFVFNVGEGTAQDFVITNCAIESGDWEGAAHGLENSRWYRQVGQRGPRIVGMIRTGKEDVCCG